jgi:hypothetical protein
VFSSGGYFLTSEQAIKLKTLERVGVHLAEVINISLISQACIEAKASCDFFIFNALLKALATYECSGVY